MSIEKEFYLSCDNCSKTHTFKGEDELEVQEDSEDEGWVSVYGSSSAGACDAAQVHYCPDCN